MFRLLSCIGDISEFFIHLFFLIFPVDSLTRFFEINSFYFIHSFKERCLHSEVLKYYMKYLKEMDYMDEY